MNYATRCLFYHDSLPADNPRQDVSFNFDSNYGLAVISLLEVRRIKGDTGALCTFETATGEYLSLTKPLLGDEQEKEIKQLLRRILVEAA